MRQLAVEIDDEVDGARLRPVEVFEKILKTRAGGLGRAVDDEVGLEVLAVVERPVLGGLLDEEIERVVDRHVGDDVDLDLELGDELREDIAGEPVAVQVLLVVHEMPGRRHLERVRDDAGAAVWRGPEPYNLRTQRHRPVVSIVGQVMDRGADGHGLWRTPRRSLQPFIIRCAAQSSPL